MSKLILTLNFHRQKGLQDLQGYEIILKKTYIELLRKPRRVI